MSSTVSRSARLLVIAGQASGLVTAGEGALTPDKLKRLADLVERSVDLDALLELAVPLRVEPPGGAPPPEPVRARIGVARDSAFCFYYRDNFALELAGRFVDACADPTGRSSCRPATITVEAIAKEPTPA